MPLRVSLKRKFFFSLLILYTILIDQGVYFTFTERTSILFVCLFIFSFFFLSIFDVFIPFFVCGKSKFR